MPPDEDATVGASLPLCKSPAFKEILLEPGTPAKLAPLLGSIATAYGLGGRKFDRKILQ